MIHHSPALAVLREAGCSADGLAATTGLTEPSVMAELHARLSPMN